jgi:hypothetical protein
MKNNRRFGSYYSIFIRQVIIFIVTIVLISGIVFGNNNDDLRVGIADPAHIPDFHDFSADSIVPGSTGSLKFTIKNRYTNDTFEKSETFNNDTTMYNVSLIINIYLYTTLEESKDVRDISHSPKIVGGNAALQTTTNQWTAEYFWPVIQEDETVSVTLKIKSYSDTPQGTYFIRMHLNFTFNNTPFDMKSRGHFTQSQWDRATQNITDQEGVTEEGLVAGRINLDKLDVSGIIPETSVHIKEPIPIWPFYVIVGLAVFCLFMGIIFYYMDEKGMFPKAKEKIDGFSERVNNFRYRRK